MRKGILLIPVQIVVGAGFSLLNILFLVVVLGALVVGIIRNDASRPPPPASLSVWSTEVDTTSLVEYPARPLFSSDGVYLKVGEHYFSTHSDARVSTVPSFVTWTAGTLTDAGCAQRGNLNRCMHDRITFSLTSSLSLRFSLLRSGILLEALNGNPQRVIGAAHNGLTDEKPAWLVISPHNLSAAVVSTVSSNQSKRVLLTVWELPST